MQNMNKQINTAFHFFIMRSLNNNSFSENDIFVFVADRVPFGSFYDYPYAYRVILVYQMMQESSFSVTIGSRKRLTIN